MRVRASAIVTPEGQVADAILEISAGMIVSITEDENAAVDRELTGTLIPGFIDIHCHGGAGFYFSDDVDNDVREAIAFHRSQGTTSLNASLVTASIPELSSQVKRLVPLVQSGLLAGIHLEGPYLSKDRCGAHDPELLRSPEMSEIKGLLALGEGCISMVTIAPELPDALEVISFLKSKSVIAAIGHTDATASDMAEGIMAGAEVVTHFTNAMQKLNFDSAADFLLYKSELPLELILDGIHVDPKISLELLKTFTSRIILVTDAMSAAGCSDGNYRIGKFSVEVQDDVARLQSNGALAGSTLTMKRAFFGALDSGVNLVDAVRMCSTNAADLLKQYSIGRISVGARADLLLYDQVSRQISVLEGVS